MNISILETGISIFSICLGIYTITAAIKGLIKINGIERRMKNQQKRGR